MIPVLDASGNVGKSVLEGAELQAALTTVSTAVTAGTAKSEAVRALLAAGIQVTQASAVLPTGTDRGGSIATANTAQQVAPANPARTGMTFQNTSDTAMRLTENGAAATATTGYLVNAGVAVNLSTRNLVSVFCSTAGKTFASTEY